VNHKLLKDQILQELYDNRGEKRISASQISSQIWHKSDIDLSPRKTEAYLLELMDEKMVKREKGKSTKVGKDLIPARDTYYISQTGIEYVDAEFVKIKTQSDMARLLDVNLKANELLSLILQSSNLSLTEQQKQSELMSMLTDALDSKDDSKARNVLIKGLSIGKEIGVPLLIEYLKGYFKLGA